METNISPLEYYTKRYESSLKLKKERISLSNIMADKVLFEALSVDVRRFVRDKIERLKQK